VEATTLEIALRMTQQGLASKRPLTHELIVDILEAAGVSHRSVEISSLRDEIFYADLKLSNGESVSSRPSDAIILALYTGATIFVATKIIDEAGFAEE
jgi:bifunctional DNase/RNase